MICEESVVAFFQDEGVLGFFSEQVLRYVPRREFDALNLPAGLSREGAWEVLCGMRKVLGTPIRSILSRADGRDVWFNVTPTMSASLSRIAELTREASPLTRSLVRRADRGLSLQPAEEEVVSALARCGVGIDLASYDALLRGHRPVDDGCDVLAMNLVSVLRDLPALSSRELDLHFIEEIYAKLKSGAEAPEGDRGVARVHMPYYRQDATRSEVLSELERMYAMHRDGSIPAIVAGISASDAIWQYAPFGCWSGAVELALRAVFFTKVGCPGLAFCPFSGSNGEWESGVASASLDGYAINETGFESPLGVDATVFYSHKIDILEEGLERMLEAVSAASRRRDSLEGAVERDPRLNHRQRAVLVDMLDDPSMSLDAKAHQANQGVSLMTARTDLKKLAEFDYLYRSESDGRMVFRACPDVAVKLSRLLTERPA